MLIRNFRFFHDRKVSILIRQRQKIQHFLMPVIPKKTNTIMSFQPFGEKCKTQFANTHAIQLSHRYYRGIPISFTLFSKLPRPSIAPFFTLAR